MDTLDALKGPGNPYWEVQLDSTEAGIYLGGKSSPIPPDTMSDWRFRKIGPSYIKMGGRGVRYRLCDLNAYMEKQRCEL